MHYDPAHQGRHSSRSGSRNPRPARRRLQGCQGGGRRTPIYRDWIAKVVVDAGGHLVTPGLIDVHVHVFAGVSHYGIEPDPTCLARGATTVVDAGSAGADTFPGFRKYVIDVSATRILAQLNISSQGMLTREIGELMNPDYANVEKACAMIEANRGRHSGSQSQVDQEHHRRPGSGNDATLSGSRSGRCGRPSHHGTSARRLVRINR